LTLTGRISRRDFVCGGALAVSSIFVGRAAAALEPGFRRSMLVLDSPGPEVGVDLLQGIAGAFLSRGVPLAYAIDPLNERAHNPAAMAYLAQVAASEPGLVELVLVLQSPDEPGRFFEMRAAEKLRSAAADLLAVDGAPVRPATILDLREEGEIDLPAWRSAGFHVLLRPNGQPAVAAQFQGAEQVRLDGGQRLPLPETTVEIATLLQVLSGEGDKLIVLSLDGLADREQDAALAQAEALANALSEELLGSGMFLTRPTDILLHSEARLPENVALLVEQGTGTMQPQVEAFVRALAAEGLPFTLAVRSGANPSATGDPSCLILSAGPEEAKAVMASCACRSRRRRAPARKPCLRGRGRWGGAWWAHRPEGGCPLRVRNRPAVRDRDRAAAQRRGSRHAGGLGGQCRY
jgi:hypothetical protein